MDEKKYEGHTPGPWCVIIHEGMHITPDENNSYRLAWNVTEEADADLIADAPDLLAEVKRLREILEWMTDSTEPPEDWSQKLPPDGTAWPWPPQDYAMNEIARLALDGKTYLEIRVSFQ